MFKIGIDLSTTNTGIVVLDKDNNLVDSFVISFRTFSEINHKYNFSLIEGACNRILGNSLIEGACVGIELANFKNALLTSRFSLYAGAFIEELVKHNLIKEIKCFNSNQWQKFVGVNIGSDTRETTKAKAREFARTHCKEYNENWTEDLCDAYCIAYHLENVKSNEQKTNEIKHKKSEYVKQAQLKHKNNKMIETRLNKIQQLDSIKNKKKIDRLYNEIEELRNEIRHKKQDN